MSRTITAVVVGAGHRSCLYASLAKQSPEKLQIVGVVDPADHRREACAKEYNLTEDQCFHTVEELCAKGKIADAVINGTMDQLHVPTSIPLLKAGYDILLEKPFATHEKEMMELVEVARKHDRKVMICHVLRYAPFYNEIRKKVLAGEIGTIMNVQTVEHVSYHHAATAFIRGKWNREDVCGVGHLISKCCHDLDLIMWMMSGQAPTSVSSFGNQMYFNEKNAPEGSGTRCLVDCKIEADCPFSARKQYIDHALWKPYAWEAVEHLGELTDEQKLEHMKQDSRYGRCVWRCDNTIVDHQSVMIEFANGATATHNLVSGTARPARHIHLLGTHGELQGCFDESVFVIRKAALAEKDNYSEEKFDLNLSGDFHGMDGGHGGGDMRLVEDFINFIQGEKPSIACTQLADSVYSHLVGFRAEKARLEHSIVEIPQI